MNAHNSPLLIAWKFACTGHKIRLKQQNPQLPGLFLRLQNNLCFVGHSLFLISGLFVLRIGKTLQPQIQKPLYLYLCGSMQEMYARLLNDHSGFPACWFPALLIFAKGNNFYYLLHRHCYLLAAFKSTLTFFATDYIKFYIYKYLRTDLFIQVVGCNIQT